MSKLTITARWEVLAMIITFSNKYSNNLYSVPGSGTGGIKGWLVRENPGNLSLETHFPLTRN